MCRFLDGTLDVKGVNVFEDPTTSKKSESCVHHKFSNPKSDESQSASNEEQNEWESSRRLSTLDIVFSSISNSHHLIFVA